MAFPLIIIDRGGNVGQLSHGEIRYSNYNWCAAGGLAARRQGDGEKSLAFSIAYVKLNILEQNVRLGIQNESLALKLFTLVVSLSQRFSVSGVSIF